MSFASSPLPTRTDVPVPDAVRVMFVSSHAQLGGGEAYLRSIVEGLGDGWVAEIVSLQDGPFVARLREGGHEVTVVPAPGRTGFLAAAWRLRERVRYSRPSVIHANGIKAALVAAIATLASGPPVVWLKFDFGWDGWLAKLVAVGCKQIVGISTAVHGTFGPVLSRKTRVVYAGIPDYPADLARGRKLLERALGTVPEGPVIALSGRLCPGKGQTDLISAAPAVLAAHPNARLVFLGVEDSFYPNHRSELENLAEALSVRDALAFADIEGHRPADAVAVVSASDVLVAPSRRQERGGWSEGFGLAAVEALHVGTPVVAYDNGALPEVLGDCGLIVPEGDSVALGQALVQLLDDETLRRSLIACGRRRARERYRLSRVVREMAECYREAAMR